MKRGEELKYLRKYTYNYPSNISVSVSIYRSIFALDILYEYLLLVKDKNDECIMVIEIFIFFILGRCLGRSFTSGGKNI